MAWDIDELLYGTSEDDYEELLDGGLHQYSWERWSSNLPNEGWGHERSSHRRRRREADGD